MTHRAPPQALSQAHEWVSFDDPVERRHWVFDVTFLLSNWTCLFGRGCQGVLTGPAPERVLGCCSYGAHFADDSDVSRVEAVAASLSDDEWQFARRGRRQGVVKTTRSGERLTRIVEGACVFLNRVGFRAGPGCSLHQAALGRGTSPMSYKPLVCWQLPLRREDTVDEDGWVTSRLIQWERKHWGSGGFEFHWWCTDEPDAFVGAEPVYRAMRDELEAMVGGAVHELLAAYLDARSAEGSPLPHPALSQPGGQRQE